VGSKRCFAYLYWCLSVADAVLAFQDCVLGVEVVGLGVDDRVLGVVEGV